MGDMRTLLLSMTLIFGPVIAAWAADWRSPVGPGWVLSTDQPLATLDPMEGDWQPVHWGHVEQRTPWFFRTTVEISPTMAAEPLALFITAVASSEAWWDGKPLAANGHVGDVATEIPGRLVGRFPLNREQAAPGQHQLLIRFSSAHAAQRIQTPVDELYIAPFGPHLEGMVGHYLPSLIAGGALLLALLVVVGLAWLTRDRSAGWLALACVGASFQLASETLRAFVNYPYPWHFWRMLGVASGAAMAGAGIVLFCNERFGRGRMARMVPLVYLIIAGATLALLSGSDMATFLVVIAAMMCCATLSIDGIRAGRTGAWFALAAILAVAAAMVSDLMIFLDRSLFIALVAIVVAFVVEHIRQFVQTRRERDQAQLRAATLELELLKRHLRPHFLLNSLTLLTEWLETHPQQATRFVDALGKEFRLLNRLMDRQLISLEEELDLCRAHLKVMELRFETTFVLDVEQDLHGIELPPATLHTLLENAITHNQYLTGQDVRFSLRVKHDTAVELQFIAPCGEPRETRTAGTGIETIRSRLKASIGPLADLRWELTQGACVTTITWPAAAEKGNPVGHRACA